MRTFRDAIDAHAAARPNAPCVIAPEPEAVLTYGDLARIGAELGAFLAQQGIAPGSVVSFMLPNGVAAASIFLGAMYAGYVVSPVNLVAQDTQLAYTLAHSGTRIVFAAPEFIDRLHALRPRDRGDVVLRATDPDRLDLADAPATALTTVAEETSAMLMYTSGTTGEPKGVLLTHRNMIHAGRVVATAQGLDDTDRVLSSLPLYHINGQCIATVAPVVAGGSIVMPRRFSASQWWPLVERYRPTWL